LAKKGKNPARSVKQDEEIILDMIIRLTARIQTIIEYSNDNEDYIEHLILNPNKNKERAINTMASLMILQGDKDFFSPKEMREKIIEILNSISFDSNIIYPYHITKILHELENDGLLENIKTKKKIKESGFSKDFKKSGAGEGYPSLYHISPNIKEYVRVLKNENNIKRINEYLKKYTNLNQFYNLFYEAFMKMMISNSNELRKLLELIAKSIGYPLDGTPDLSNWDIAVKEMKKISDNDRKKFCSDFVNKMINSPNNLVYICFLISL